MLLLLAVALPAANAAPLVSVDFNVSNASGLLQEGFESWICASDAKSKTIIRAFPVSDTTVPGNVVTVEITSSSSRLIGRERVPHLLAKEFAWGSLYRDLIIASGSNTKITVTFSGLAPDTAYNVTFFTIDPDNTSSSSIRNTTQNISHGRAVTYSKNEGKDYNSRTSFDVGAIFGPATSDADGRLTFMISTTGNPGNQAILNGFRISSSSS